MIDQQRFALCLALVALACGDSDGGDASPTAPLTRATVTFVYEAETALDPQVAERFPGCATGVGHTHIHPSWRAFSRLDMTAGEDRWTITFDDVPVGSRERIRVSDPNVCAENSTGAATQGVVANGVRLTEIVDTPGTGTEPGFAFTVAVDGTVAP